jgi:DNA replication protein DnaC
MQKLNEVIDLPARLAEIGQARRRYREAQIAKYGWSQDVGCASCGDTGRTPDDDRACHCHRGDGIRQREERIASWETRCPKRFRRFTLETHPNQQAIVEVREWVNCDAGTGRNLFLLGPVGTGKTGLAIGALRELHLRGLNVRFATVPDILDALRPKKPDEPYSELGMRDLQRVQVLLMDDLGAEKSTVWVKETLFKAVNGRYERGLPTIITANPSMPELRELVGERTMSRLTEDAALVYVGGRDLRREKA